jgi:hypothetical protein
LIFQGVLKRVSHLFGPYWLGYAPASSALSLVDGRPCSATLSVAIKQISLKREQFR